MSELVAYAAEPVQVSMINSEEAARPGLGRHIADLEISPMSDFGSVPAGMGYSPEGLVTFEQSLPLTFHDRKQHGDLSRPNTLPGPVA